MNAFYDYFNPMNAFLQGQAFLNQGDEAAWRNQERLRENAQRQALAEFGQGGYLTGFEGVSGAERAPDLQALYRAFPEAAMQIEQHRAAPFAEHRKQQNTLDLQRDKIKQGWGGLATFLQGQGLMQGALSNAFSQQWEPHPVTSMETDQGMAPGAGVLAPPPRPSSAVGGMGSGDPIDRISGMKYSVKTNAEGMPMAEVDYESPFSRELRTREDAQKARQLELNASKTSEDLEAGREARIQVARDNVYKYGQELKDLIKQSFEGVDVRGQLEWTRNKLANEEARLRKMEGGGTEAISSAQLTPEEKAMAAKAKAKSPGAARPVMPSPLSDAGVAGVGKGLPPKQRIEAQAKAVDLEQASTRKSIDEARQAKEQIVSMLPKITRQWDMLQQDDIGSKWLQFPGATTGARMMNATNDEFERLHDDLGKVFMKEGQSQLMNTLVERMMQTAGIPTISTDPQVNRRNVVHMRNMIEQQIANYPAFLEHWARVNNGSLDGALDVYTEWSTSFPMYESKEGKGGRVTMQRNKSYMPWDRFINLKASGKIGYIP